MAGRCDDGNKVSGDGCSATCVAEVGYECSANPGPCVKLCGNRKLDAGEACETASLGTSGCLTDCTVDPLWQCTGSLGSQSSCSPICGDGKVAGTEQAFGNCDDGNTQSGDGCSATCKV